MSLTAVGLSRFDCRLMPVEFSMLPATVLVLLTLPQAPETVVTCLVPDAGRVYRLAPGEEGEDVGWTLSMRPAPGDDWIHLALPRAAPRVGKDTVSLSYRNANGGRQVELDVRPSGSRLDVWVDYGLDVNIEPDLDPDVDEMNTDGPIEALECTIASR
jgi:hypothetical protein